MKSLYKMLLGVCVAKLGLICLAPQNDSEPVHSVRAKSGNLVNGKLSSSLPAPAPISWNDLESTNYFTFVENLRKFGCPEQTIQEIVYLDLASNLKDLPCAGEKRMEMMTTLFGQKLQQFSMFFHAAGTPQIETVSKNPIPAFHPTEGISLQHDATPNLAPSPEPPSSMRITSAHDPVHDPDTFSEGKFMGDQAAEFENSEDSDLVEDGESESSSHLTPVFPPTKMSESSLLIRAFFLDLAKLLNSTSVTTEKLLQAQSLQEKLHRALRLNIPVYQILNWKS